MNSPDNDKDGDNGKDTQYPNNNNKTRACIDAAPRSMTTTGSDEDDDIPLEEWFLEKLVRYNAISNGDVGNNHCTSVPASLPAREQEGLQPPSPCQTADGTSTTSDPKANPPLRVSNNHDNSQEWRSTTTTTIAFTESRSIAQRVSVGDTVPMVRTTEEEEEEQGEEPPLSADHAATRAAPQPPRHGVFFVPHDDVESNGQTVAQTQVMVPSTEPTVIVEATRVLDATPARVQVDRATRVWQVTEAKPACSFSPLLIVSLCVMVITAIATGVIVATLGGSSSSSSPMNNAPKAFGSRDELVTAVRTYVSKATAENVRAVYGSDIGSWDVSRITDFSYLFYSGDDDFGAALYFDEDISAWNTSLATSMAHMFDEAWYFNQPIGVWDVSSVRDMSSMFRFATSFNQPLGDWDVSSLVSMKYMLLGARDFDQDLCAWESLLQVSTPVNTFSGTSCNVTSPSGSLCHKCDASLKFDY